MTAPTDDFRRVADAQRRFEALVAGLSDDAVRRPTLLHGWTVAHLLTHVARNADSHVRRAQAAARGEVVEQYAGGYAGRARDIEAGAARDAAALLEDVRVSAQRLDHAWRATPDAAWAMNTIDVGGRERPLGALPKRRWQELEVHPLDLGLGVSHLDWSDEFVAVFLPQVRRTLDARLPDGARAPDPGVLDPRTELAWLYGRFERDDLPVLAPWA